MWREGKRIAIIGDKIKTRWAYVNMGSNTRGIKFELGHPDWGSRKEEAGKGKP